MKRYKCLVEYDGQNYSGFQVQPNAITIQEIIEKALSTLFKTDTKITASGRTDSGVSARGQVIHFDANTDIKDEKIPYAIQNLLPDDISILYCKEVSKDFHARFSAIAKTYSYKICLTNINRPLYKKYYQYPFKIDIALLKAALEKLKGKHNFKAFMSSGSDVIDFERDILAIDLVNLN